MGDDSAQQNDGFITIDGRKYLYFREHLVGEGSFGRVYKGYCVNSSDENDTRTVAIKRIQYTDGTQLRINHDEELKLRSSSVNKLNALRYFGYKHEDNLTM